MVDLHHLENVGRCSLGDPVSMQREDQWEPGLSQLTDDRIQYAMQHMESSHIPANHSTEPGLMIRIPTNRRRDLQYLHLFSPIHPRAR